MSSSILSGPTQRDVTITLDYEVVENALHQILYLPRDAASKAEEDAEPKGLPYRVQPPHIPLVAANRLETQQPIDTVVKSWCRNKGKQIDPRDDHILKMLSELTPLENGLKYTGTFDEGKAKTCMRDLASVLHQRLARYLPGQGVDASGQVSFDRMSAYLSDVDHTTAASSQRQLSELYSAETCSKNVGLALQEMLTAYSLQRQTEFTGDLYRHRLENGAWLTAQAKTEISNISKWTAAAYDHLCVSATDV